MHHFSFTPLTSELFQVEKHYANLKAGNGCDISGPYWMLMEINIVKGALSWKSDGQMKAPTQGKVYLFVPAYSWCMEYYTSASEVKMRGLISRVSLEKNSLEQPTLFKSNKSFPKNLKEVKAMLASSSSHIPVPICSNPSALSLRTKKILDTGYDSGFEIQKIATKLKTSSAVVSRTFKRDFGKPPAFYRRGLRVTVGMYELMMGTPPAEAAHLAGYEDLSRFYKQFKEYLKQTPAEYLNKSKNAKKKR